MAKNAVTAFKDILAGGSTQMDEMTAGAEAYMVELYANAYAKTYTALMSARGEINYATYARQTQLQKQIGEILGGFQADASSAIADDIRRVADYTATLAIKHVELLGSDTTKPASFYADYNSKYVEQAVKDSYAHIAAQTMKMSETIKWDLRKDTSAIMQRAAVEGLTRKEATKALQSTIIGRDPAFVFIDKAGRSWDSKKYFEMLTRTTMNNTHREVYINTLVADGQDLVIVSSHGATDECGNWEDEVLSLTGATEGYPTLDDAIGGGLFHPNCAHRLLPYDATASGIFGDTTPTD